MSPGRAGTLEYIFSKYTDCLADLLTKIFRFIRSIFGHNARIDRVRREPNPMALTLRYPNDCETQDNFHT